MKVYEYRKTKLRCPLHCLDEIRVLEMSGGLYDDV